MRQKTAVSGTTEDVDVAASEPPIDAFETLKSSIEEWAKPILNTSYKAELVLHVLELIKQKNWAPMPVNPSEVQRLTLDFCKIANSLGTGVDADFERIARCMQFVVQHQLCNIKVDSELQELSVLLYNLKAVDYAWLVNAEPPPLSGNSLQCLINVALDDNWDKLRRVTRCIQFIATNELCDLKDRTATKSLAIRLRSLSDANYAWLISARACPLSTTNVRQLINAIQHEGLWDKANERSLEVINRRLGRRNFHRELRRIYADVVRLTTEWGHGFMGIYAPSGAKEMVTKIAQRKLTLPESYPMTAASTERIDQEMDDMASMLYKIARKSLDNKEVYARAEGTEAVYQDIIDTFKPCDEATHSTALTTTGGTGTTARR